MKSPVCHILLFIVAIVIAQACDNEDYYRYGDFRYDMVTFMGNEDGAGDVYINYPVNDNTPVRLIDHAGAVSISNEDISVGDRLLLNYIVDKDNGDGTLDITARSYVQVVTDSLRYTLNMSSLAQDSVSLNSIWRTGDYINLYCRVKYTGVSRLLALVMDYDTWHNDTVHCYLSHNMMGADAYFWRRCYMSFNISAVWNLQSCKVVRVHLNDVAYPDRKYYDFIKTN